MALDATLNTHDDAALLALYAKGDPVAAQVLVQRLAPIVYAHAFRMLGQRAEAEDITQEVLLRLWNIAPQWDAQRAKVTTWLFRVTANLCVDKLRKSKRFSGDEVPEVSDDAPSAERLLQTQARKDALQVGLDQLPDRQKQAVILRHIEELSNPEIAIIMDISVEAVESLLSRGKRALVQTMSPQKDALGL